MDKKILVASVLLFLSITACDDDTAQDDSNVETAFSDMSVSVHETVETILVVSWSQDQDLDEVWIKYTFENDEWFVTPVTSRTAGDHDQVVLGIPEETEVTMHIVAAVGEEEFETEAFSGTTGIVPVGMPRPTIESYSESLASPNRWLFGTVEATPNQNQYYSGPFWLYIIDRQGRIVWYHSDLGDNPVIGFPRISRDGSYIYYGNRRPFDDMNMEFATSVVKMTLDHEYFEEIELPISDNVDMTDSGSLLFNTGTAGVYSASWLVEYLPDGTTVPIWNCGEVFGNQCYSNTVNWNPVDDTVLMSFPYLNTVIQINRESGEVVGQYGDEDGSYSFDSDMWGFDFQHYANITPEGTLMVSSHIPIAESQHAFMEFEIDRDNEVLKEKWIYREGSEWPIYMGEAHRVPGGEGNVVANYGTGGIIKEIAPSKQTAWYVKWDADFEDDLNNNMVGHCTLFDDLYAINEGPQ